MMETRNLTTMCAMQNRGMAELRFRPLANNNLSGIFAVSAIGMKQGNSVLSLPLQYINANTIYTRL